MELKLMHPYKGIGPRPVSGQLLLSDRAIASRT